MEVYIIPSSMMQLRPPPLSVHRRETPSGNFWKLGVLAIAIATVLIFGETYLLSSTPLKGQNIVDDQRQLEGFSEKNTDLSERALHLLQLRNATSHQAEDKRPGLSTWSARPVSGVKCVFPVLVH